MLKNPLPVLVSMWWLAVHREPAGVAPEAWEEVQDALGRPPAYDRFRMRGQVVTPTNEVYNTPARDMETCTRPNVNPCSGFLFRTMEGFIMPRSLSVSIAILTLSLLMGCGGKSNSDNGGGPRPGVDGRIDCDMLGDIRCGFSTDLMHSVMICMQVDASGSREWVIDEKCSELECCSSARCVSLEEGFALGIEYCILRSEGELCESDGDCEGDLYCKDGYCRERVGLGGECDSSRDCETDLICRGGTCQAITCTVDEDCVSEDPCVAGDCISGACVFETVADGTECPPVDMCHAASCISGVCVQEEDETCCLESGVYECRPETSDYWRWEGEEVERLYYCDENRWDSIALCYYPDDCSIETGDCHCPIDRFYCSKSSSPSARDVMMCPAMSRLEEDSSHTEIYDCSLECTNRGYRTSRTDCIDVPESNHAYCCCRDDPEGPCLEEVHP